MYKNIFWDFDGVLINSNSVRTEGFRYIFKEYKKELVDKLISYHTQNGGKSRYDKISFFYSHILKVSLSQETLDKKLSDYTNYVKPRLISKSLIYKKNLNLIKKHQLKNNFIVSASDEKELEQITKALEINKYFLEIMGSPNEKHQNILTIIKDYNLNIKKCVLIGDSINDFHAAINSGIDFIGHNNIHLSKKVINYSEDLVKFL